MTFEIEPELDALVQQKMAEAYAEVVDELAGPDQHELQRQAALYTRALEEMDMAAPDLGDPVHIVTSVPPVRDLLQQAHHDLAMRAFMAMWAGVGNQIAQASIDATDLPAVRRQMVREGDAGLLPRGWRGPYLVLGPKVYVGAEHEGRISLQAVRDYSGVMG
jgi:hypothetical protein